MPDNAIVFCVDIASPQLGAHPYPDNRIRKTKYDLVFNKIRDMKLNMQFFIVHCSHPQNLI